MSKESQQREALIHSLLDLGGVPEADDQILFEAQKFPNPAVFAALLETAKWEGNPEDFKYDPLVRRATFVALQKIVDTLRTIGEEKKDKECDLKVSLGRLRRALESMISPILLEDLRFVEEALVKRVGEITVWDRLTGD